MPQHRRGRMNVVRPATGRPLDAAKFQDPDRTAAGERRAAVGLRRLTTLWFNTGTLCNLICSNCYIESSPPNDRLDYLTAAEVTGYLEEIQALGMETPEIGFTSEEPLMNRDLQAMLEACLGRGNRDMGLTIH